MLKWHKWVQAKGQYGAAISSFSGPPAAVTAKDWHSKERRPCCSTPTDALQCFIENAKVGCNGREQPSDTAIPRTASSFPPGEQEVADHWRNDKWTQWWAAYLSIPEFQEFHEDEWGASYWASFLAIVEGIQSKFVSQFEEYFYIRLRRQNWHGCGRTTSKATGFFTELASVPARLSFGEAQGQRKRGRCRTDVQQCLRPKQPEATTEAKASIRIRPRKEALKLKWDADK